MSDATINQLQFESLCDNPNTHCHTLDCGHTIFSSPSSPTSSPFKSACSPNCLRAIYMLKPQFPLSWLINTSLEPFICLKCAEYCVRHDYDVLLIQHRQKGGRLANEKETNVHLWTYAAILEMVEDGGRMCEGTSGRSTTTNVRAHQSLVVGRVADLARRTVTELEELRNWEIRCTNDLVGGQQEGNVEIDVDDASQMALLLARYPKQCTVRSEEFDELADRLGDAKVGVGDENADMGTCYLASRR